MCFQNELILGTSLCYSGYILLCYCNVNITGNKMQNEVHLTIQLYWKWMCLKDGSKGSAKAKIFQGEFTSVLASIMGNHKVILPSLS